MMLLAVSDQATDAAGVFPLCQPRSIIAGGTRTVTGIDLSLATQLRSDPGWIPSRSPTRRNAPGLVAGSFRRSTAIRIARSRSSSGYFHGASHNSHPSLEWRLHQTRDETPPV